jgi:hypothetical protein
MITVNGVNGLEMWESFRKGRADGGPYVELSYAVDFADADAFVDGCMGGVVSSGGPGGQLRNVPKLKCPTNPTLYAMSAEYVGRGEANYTGNGRPEFNAAVVTVHFAVPSWPQLASDDPGGQQSFQVDAPAPIIFAECDIDIANEVIAIPSGAYMFVSDSASLNIPVPKRNTITTFRITRHYFPYLPTEKVVALVGKINNTKIFNRPRGHVLFDAARTKQVVTADGTRSQLWELVFLIKERDWNEFIRPDTGAWDEVVRKSNSSLGVYAYDELRPLVN